MRRCCGRVDGGPVVYPRQVNRFYCGPLAAWARAWLIGEAAFDDVLVAASSPVPAARLARLAPLSRVSGLARGDLPVDGADAGTVGAGGTGGDADGRPAPLGAALIAWRQARATVRLVLPVPGDVRGLAGPPLFRADAIEFGQALSGGGLGLVPQLIDHRPSSAPPTLLWRAYQIEPPTPDFISVSDAQHDLTEAIRECASVVRSAAELAGSAPRSEQLSAARRAGERINLPPNFPPRAVALIAQAERLAVVLSLAGADVSPDSAARDQRADERRHALAPLVLAVRRARLAGYNADEDAL